MTKTLKLELSVSDIDSSGAIASTFATTEYVQTELNKKVNLTPEGKVDHSQLPDYTYISGLPEALEDEHQQREEAEANILSQAKTYTNQQLSEQLKGKADLVQGKVPFSQLPYSLNLEDNLAKEFAAVRSELKQTSDDIIEQIVTLETSLKTYVDSIDTERKDYIDRAMASFLEDLDQRYDSASKKLQSDVDAQILRSETRTSELVAAVDELVSKTERYTPLAYKQGKQYEINERVTLANGIIVKSTVANNTVNPNSSMTGWTLGTADTDVATWSGRTQEEKNKDIFSVRDYIKTQINGTTSNQDGIVQAVLDAHQNGFDLFWPAGTYVSTENIPHFNDVKHYGRGVIKRGTDTFVIQPKGKATKLNIFYASPVGDDLNDGLTADKPLATVQKGLDCISNFGTWLNGSWRLELAEGTYKGMGGSASEVRSNQYIQVHCSTSTETEPKAIIDVTDTGRAFGLDFSQNMRVWCKGIKVVGTRNGSNLESGFLADAGTQLYLENCFAKDSAGNGAKANIRCRLLVSGGIYESDGTSILVYGNSTAFIGYNGKRVGAYDGSAGVSVEGSSYSHTDFVDYKNCTYGLICENESHSTNYDSTFENVTVAWEGRGLSTINSARYTFITQPTTKCRNLIPFGLGSDDQASTNTVGNRSLVFYPHLGTQGRWAFGYNQITVPNRCYQYSVDSGVSGANMSLAVNVGMSLDASTTNYLGLYAPSTAYSGIAFGDQTNANSAHIRHQGGNIYINQNQVLKYRFTDTTFGVAVDNQLDFGTASFRVKNTYLANAPIVSSDERLKQQFRSLSEREKACALEIKNSICLYKFNDAVDLKGDGARWHCGIKAQEVIKIMHSHGLNPFDYGFVCFDEWDEQEEIIESWSDEFNEDGELIREAGFDVIQEHKEAGNRYGIRYDELAMFILSSI